MKALIVYNSKRGKTARYARAIAMYLWQKGFSISLCATHDYSEDKLESCDLLVTGCWTSGWFIINQYPNKLWRDFANKLPKNLPPYLILFTTYKIRTGTMFRNMRKRLTLSDVILTENLKSKTGVLTDVEKRVLDKYAEIIKHSKKD